jgi:hypothetical protein
VARAGEPAAGSGPRLAGGGATSTSSDRPASNGPSGVRPGRRRQQLLQQVRPGHQRLPGFGGAGLDGQVDRAGFAGRGADLARQASHLRQQRPASQRQLIEHGGGLGAHRRRGSPLGPLDLAAGACPARAGFSVGPDVLAILDTA